MSFLLVHRKQTEAEQKAIKMDEEEDDQDNDEDDEDEDDDDNEGEEEGGGSGSLKSPPPPPPPPPGQPPFSEVMYVYLVLLAREKEGFVSVVFSISGALHHGGLCVENHSAPANW